MMLLTYAKKPIKTATILSTAKTVHAGKWSSAKSYSSKVNLVKKVVRFSFWKKIQSCTM